MRNLTETLSNKSSYTSLIYKVYEGREKKPSDLKKISHTERKVTNHYIDSDVYDFSDPGHDQEDTYVDSNINAYITDKEGNVYDVIAKTKQEDAGRIAGGSTHYYVTIKDVKGIGDISLDGYTAIFSSGYNADIIVRISSGHYLEDYLAKYYFDDPKIKELQAKGDKDAVSWSDRMMRQKEEDTAAFWERYISLPDYLIWTVKDGDISFRTSRGSSKYDDSLKTALGDTVEGLILKEFKKSSISDLNGLQGNVLISFEGQKKYYWDEDKITLVLDTKENIIGRAVEKYIKSTKSYKAPKFEKSEIRYSLGMDVTADQSSASDFVKTLFKDAEAKYKKLHKKGDFINSDTIAAEYNRLYSKWASNWYYGDKPTKKSAKDSLSIEFDRDLEKTRWDGQKKPVFDWPFIKSLLDVYDNPNTEKELEDAIEKTNVEELEMSPRQRHEAETKMTAWHEGKRKQNVKACSDSKLKTYYNICKELGYDKEASELKSEADKRKLFLD